MRTLLPGLALAQALGILLVDRLESSWSRPATEAVLLAGIGALGLGSIVRAPALRVPLVLASAALAGAFALGVQLETAHPRAVRDGDATVEATLGAWLGANARVLEAVHSVDPSDAVPARLMLRNESAPVGDVTGRASPASALAAALPGERWRLRVRIRPPRGLRNPGRGDRDRSLQRRGIGGVARLVHPALAVRIGEQGEGGLGRLRAWRRERVERLSRSGPGGPLLAALALGARTQVTRERRGGFDALGLSHLLAVSGLHLSLVGVFVFSTVRYSLARSAAFAARADARRPALVAALLMAGVYAGLTGPAIPVQRAFLLLAAAVLAVGTRRPRRRVHPLAFASLCILGREPASLFEAGFQLSFAATAALLSAVSDLPPAPEAGRLASVRRRVGALLRISAAALLATAPLSALHFGRIAPVGLLTNLIAIPVTAVAVLPASFLGLLATLGEGAGSRGLLALCERVGAGALLAVEAAASRLPGAQATAPPSWLAFATAAVIALLAVRARATSVRIVAVALQAAVLAVLPPAAVTPGLPRAVFLDVGQGDATLVQGRRASLLVDAGPRVPFGFDAGRDTVVPALRALGVRRLDRLIVTHADLDHRGGVPAVLGAVPVDTVWLPPGGRADPAFATVRAAARMHAVPVLERDASDPPEILGDLSIVFLGPDPTVRLERNDRSLVVRVGIQRDAPEAPEPDVRVLLPGDIEGTAERGLLARSSELSADVLKLAHHGSRTSSSADFLSAVSPRLAVASAPCRGRFGMPHRSVRVRLADSGAQLAWTGRDGAVIVGLTPRLPVRRWGASRPGCEQPGELAVPAPE